MDKINVYDKIMIKNIKRRRL